MDEQTYQALQSADWERLSFELLTYASIRVRRLRWQTRRREPVLERHVEAGSPSLAGGLTLQDIVQESIRKVLSGERVWDLKKDPDLLSYLKGVISSEVSNLVRSHQHTLTQRLPETEVGDELHELVKLADPMEDHAAETRPSLPKTPLESAIAREQEEADAELFGELIDEIADDTELNKMVEAIMDGQVKPAAIAEHMKLDAKRVYKLREKLDRKVRIVEKRLGRKLGQVRDEGSVS